MHSLLPFASIVLLAGFAAATGDISLSQFTPRIDNLPTQCKTVYNTKIDGCVSSDFNPGATCSVQCLAGLARITASVKTGCSAVDVGETSIIGVFQNGLGVAALCPNNQQSTTSAASPSPSSAASSSNPGSTTKTTLQTSSRASTPVATTASPAPSTAASSGLAGDSTATQASSTSFKFNDPTAAPTSSSAPSSAPGSNSQLSNSDSGGGSPFDVVATGAAGMTKAAMASVLAAFLFGACL